MRKKRRPTFRPPPFTVAQILSWADEFHARTGQWPKINSGRIPGTADDTWLRVNAALSFGYRGLPGGSTLPKLLAEQRGVRCWPYLPPLTEKQILAWADEHRARTGAWPHAKLGLIPGTNGETWVNIDAVLNQGMRGFPGGSSLAQLLAQRRGARNQCDLPRLTLKQILAWADAFQARTGKWPTTAAGPIAGAMPGETWRTVNRALVQGIRGLRGNSSLARLLDRRRGKKNLLDLPRLTKAQILRWADAHHHRSGRWPKRASGSIPGSGGLTWKTVDTALFYGCRGLPGGETLPRLLSKRRQVRHWREAPRLTLPTIISWAEQHRTLTGQWPTDRSGRVIAAPGETWQNLKQSLFAGRRGLPGGVSLARLLGEPGSYAPPENFPYQLSLEQVRAWAEEHYRLHHEWPTHQSGQVHGQADLSWQQVELALYWGSGGLPGHLNLRDLCNPLARKQRRAEKAQLSEEQILAWADAYFLQHGKWPTANAGAIDGATGEHWRKIDSALRRGRRGLPAGSSLASLLALARGKRNNHDLRPLTVAQILRWAKQHQRRTGHWPKQDSGAIAGTNGESWRSVEAALRKGGRGLRGRTTLFRLLSRVRSD